MDNTKSLTQSILQSGEASVPSASLDTASLYKCEHIIGQYLKENEINRSDIWITSKLNPKIMDKSEGEILESIYKTLKDLNCCDVINSLSWPHIYSIIKNNYLISNTTLTDALLVISVVFKSPNCQVHPTIIKFRYKININNTWMNPII
jgi:hypothetical protein